MSAPVALVMAKVPIPGQVKTRLAASEGPVRAARLATAALLDTLDVCEVAFGLDRCHLSLGGDLDLLDDPLLVARLQTWTVHRQRGTGLGERIANAHRDVHARADAAVVQIGMDTPQATRGDLDAIAGAVAADRPVLGLADDGGWWVLASGAPGHVDGLERVPMSTPGTGRATWDLLQARASMVGVARVLRDVDDAADADHVAALAPATRFARTWRDGRTS
ncbi:MAG: TIGR04282 family arsenosugar biosynthesis glycosyltransferase [Cellulomonas sp.]